MRHLCIANNAVLRVLHLYVAVMLNTCLILVHPLHNSLMVNDGVLPPPFLVTLLDTLLDVICDSQCTCFLRRTTLLTRSNPARTVSQLIVSNSRLLDICPRYFSLIHLGTVCMTFLASSPNAIVEYGQSIDL